MNLKLLSRTTALLCTLATPSLAASDWYTTTVFETVDGIGFAGTLIDITGVVRNEGASRTVELITYYQGTSMAEHVKVCERYATTAMVKPGQYYFELRSAPGWYAVDSIVGCKLTRR